MATKKPQAIRREIRVRKALKKVAGGRPRLTIFRSSAHIYAQVIDDKRGHTVAAASSLEKEFKDRSRNSKNKAAAEVLGELLAGRLKAKKIGRVVFDRGTYLYHGRVKVLADAIRKAGIDF